MRRQVFWIAELFIWLLILFLVSGVILFAKYNYKKNFNTYQMFLPDVDGLISGSPVKIMGINVGYVNQIDIVGEDVYVKFIITVKDIKIPRGSIATVEGAGLGGSKSLEIYPPKNKDKTPTDKLLIAQPPKRIHDSIGLLMNMFEDIAEVEYKASNFMKKVGIISNKEAMKKNAEDQVSAEKILKDTNSWIDEAQKTCDDFNIKLEKLRTKGLRGKFNGSKSNEQQN